MSPVAQPCPQSLILWLRAQGILFPEAPHCPEGTRPPQHPPPQPWEMQPGHLRRGHSCPSTAALGTQLPGHPRQRGVPLLLHPSLPLTAAFPARLGLTARAHGVQRPRGGGLHDVVLVTDGGGQAAVRLVLPAAALHRGARPRESSARSLARPGARGSQDTRPPPQHELHIPPAGSQHVSPSPCTEPR